MPETETVQTDAISNGQPVVTQDTQVKTPSAAELEAELAKTRDALKQANSESATRRKKLEEYEKAEQARRDAELSETEKLNKRLADAEQQKEQALKTANDRLLKAAFVAEAALAGAEFPGDAFLLADRTSVTIDEDGNVTGAKEAVEAIVKSGRLPLKDKRVKAPNLDGGAGGGGSAADKTQANLTEAELQVARKMGVKPEAYAANKQK